MPSLTIQNFRNTANIVTELGSPYANGGVLYADCLTLDSNIFSFPQIKSCNLNDNTDQTDQEDEGGNIYTFDGKRKVGVELEFLQQDVASMDLFANTLRGKNIRFMKEIKTTPVNGKYEYLVVPNAHVNPSIQKNSPGGAWKGAVAALPNVAAITLDLTAYDTGMSKTLTCTSFAIPAGSYYKYYTENA